MKLQEQYTYGNDIEFHLFDKERNKMVSAIPVLGCDKNNPINLGDGINFYADNILGETSFPPYNSKEEMVDRFHTVFSRIQKCIGPRYRLVNKAAHIYDDEALSHPKAKEIGCSVNFDAYTVAPNTPIPFQDGMRTTGFHIHIGNKRLLDFQTRLDVIKLMDILVGCPSVVFDRDNTAEMRRKIYGYPSEHRPTPFGLEYRPLSTGILNSKQATELTFDLVNFSLSKLEDGSLQSILGAVSSEKVKTAIKKCDAGLALSVLQDVKFPKDLLRRIRKNYNTDFYKSWGI